jgi:hypothetical protein
MKWRIRTLAVAVASLGVTMQPGCIFFVGDPGPLQSKRCGFKGDTGMSATTCGSCIASSCQSAVDACCTSSSCQGDLNYLDSCAGSADADSTAATACYTLTTQEVFNDPSGAFATLGSCVQQNCASKCAGSSEAGLPTTGVTCTSSNQGCSCVATSLAPPTTSDCEQALFMNGTCCGDTGYPAAPGTSCTCAAAAYACATDAIGECDCTSSPDLPPWA